MISSDSKILVLVPEITLIGGIANYYQSLTPFLSKNFIYFTRGSRGKGNLLSSFYWFVFDIVKLFIKLIYSKPDAVIINTSISQKSLRRDAIFIFTINLISNSKVIVFFRGWDNSYFENTMIPKWFYTTFLKADAIIILAKSFKEKLKGMGYEGPIFVETTAVNENILKIREYPYKISDVKNLLFMSRIEADKGIYELIDAYQILQKRVAFNLNLNIAGNGSDFKDINQILKTSNIKNVYMHGFVKDIDKSDLLNSASIFIFPSSHGEGMPNSVLEAMAFGIPVITTRVGGITDFFEEGKMGLFLDSTNPIEIAAKVEMLLNNTELMTFISHYNYNYAKRKFYARIVANRLMDIVGGII
jgi:glycosyltransferase involved in cell wall biosynthesis